MDLSVPQRHEARTPFQDLCTCSSLCLAHCPRLTADGPMDMSVSGLSCHILKETLPDPPLHHRSTSSLPVGCFHRVLSSSFMAFLTVALDCAVLNRSVMSDFATLQTVALQAPLSVGFSRQEYWSGLPFPPSGNLPNPGIKPQSLALQADRFFTV